MFNTIKKYYSYYICDLKQTGLPTRSLKTKLIDRRYKFYKSLRLTECLNAYVNEKNYKWLKPMRNLLLLRHVKLCDKYNWTIPINVFGPGLAIVHSGTIVVNGSAKIGKNCRIHVCTNIGQAIVKGVSGAPYIGDNVYIGPGAKLFGPIYIGDNTAIGANAVVNASFDGNCTIAGAPAIVISNNDSSAYIRHVT